MKAIIVGIAMTFALAVACGGNQEEASARPDFTAVCAAAEGRIEVFPFPTYESDRGKALDEGNDSYRFWRGGWVRYTTDLPEAMPTHHLECIADDAVGTFLYPEIGNGLTRLTPVDGPPVIESYGEKK